MTRIVFIPLLVGAVLRSAAPDEGLESSAARAWSTKTAADGPSWSVRGRHSASDEAPINAATAGSVNITLTALRSSEGRARLLLFANSEGFPDQPARAVDRAVMTIEGGTASAVLHGLAPGDYAITVIHDENDNEQLDRGWFGIPKEGIGFSNNPKIRRGPPSFAEAAFVVKAGEVTQQRVRVVYF